MLTRRQFIASAAGTAGTLAALQGCSSGLESYEQAAQRTWRDGEYRLDRRTGLQLELVRHATLAPSSHNTQCWKFRIEERGISILPDFSRRCPAVDPDDHHLFVSLGCAAENLAQAALAHSLRAHAVFDPAQGGALRIALDPTGEVATPLFRAITRRQCSRAEYDGRALSMDELRLLEKAGSGAGVRVLLLTGRDAMEKVLEYVVAGNTAQMADLAFVGELKAWIRFSGADAVRSGDGLYSASSGNPAVPAWLGRLLFPLFFTPEAENERYAKHLRSSAGIAVFVSDADDRAHWVEAGRCYERFALQAAALGIRNAFVNQPVEVGSLRPQFSAVLGLDGRRPDLVVRFGRGPEMPRSLRRPVEAVLA